MKHTKLGMMYNMHAVNKWTINLYIYFSYLLVNSFCLCEYVHYNILEYSNQAFKVIQGCFTPPQTWMT